MKSILLSFILFITFQLGFSQCNQTVSNFGNNTSETSYNITGDVSVTLNTNNTLTLNLASNFSTASGPDVRAYLVSSNGMSNTQLKNTRIANLENIELGLVACFGCIPQIPANGAKSFTVNIPNGKDIKDFDKVFFYCLAFDQFWDLGTFTSFNSTNCSQVLSIEENINNPISIYPNPAKESIHISNLKSNLTSINIVNSLGKIVYQQNNKFSEDIDVSHLKSGFYFLSIISDGRKTSKKLIIE